MNNQPNQIEPADRLNTLKKHAYCPKDKLTIYPFRGLREQIDKKYDEYRRSIERSDNFLAVSKSQWLLNHIIRSLEIDREMN